MAILAIILFIGLIVVHEWGHFIAARRGGVTVEEFGIGFPPRAWGRKLKSGLLLSINWLPIGGFVRLKGEHDAAKGKGSFGAAPLKTKVKIMLAGVVMNLIVALGLFTLLAWTGMPKLIDNQFSVASDTKTVYSAVAAQIIMPGSPAEQAGLQTSDKIISFASASCSGTNCTKAVTSSDQLRSLTQSLAGQDVLVTIVRDKQEQVLNVRLLSEETVAASKKTSEPRGYFGVVPLQLESIRNTWSAPITAVGLSAQLTQLTLKAIGEALVGLAKTIAGIVTFNSEARQNGQSQASKQVGGPVAIFNILWGSGTLGLAFILMIIAILSLTLAIMNVLPIPALDGGRLFVTLLFRAIKKPLTRDTEERIHGTGMAVLLILFVLITIVDVRRFY